MKRKQFCQSDWSPENINCLGKYDSHYTPASFVVVFAKPF